MRQFEGQLRKQSISKLGFFWPGFYAISPPNWCRLSSIHECYLTGHPCVVVKPAATFYLQTNLTTTHLNTNFFKPETAPAKEAIHSFWQIEGITRFHNEHILPKGIVELIFNLEQWFSYSC